MDNTNDVQFDDNQFFQVSLCNLCAKNMNDITDLHMKFSNILTLIKLSSIELVLIEIFRER